LTPGIVRTRAGALMVSETPARQWILCQWVHGRVADWDHLGDALRCAEVLARFHLAARGYEQRPKERPRAYWGIWPEKLARRRKAMAEFTAMAAERIKAGTGTRFDEKVVAESPAQAALADEALAVLGATEYSVLCSRYQALSQVVHGDPAGRNFVCTEYGHVRIIDLETVRQDIPAADLAKLLRRVLKKHHWDRRAAEAILERYQSVLPLEPEMMPLVYALVAFPTKYYRDLRRYYEDRQGWTQKRLLHKFRKHLRYERGRPDLLDKLRGVLRHPAGLREEADV